MGDFQLIETDFCNADETINFGTRTCSSESLFEISTLICFKSDDELFTGLSDVSVETIMKNGHLYFSNGKNLKVFRGPEVSELTFHASFSDDIICMAIYPNQQLLAVCLETGMIKLLKMNENGEFTLIFSRILHEGASPQNICAYESIEDLNGFVAQFLVIFVNGIVIRISVKDTYAKENQFEVVNEELCNLSSNVNFSSFLYPLLITNGSCCNVFNTETQEVIRLDLPFQVKKIFPLVCKFLCLDFEGKLRKLCSLTMNSFVIDYECLLEDVLVLQDGMLLAVTKPNETGDFFLQLLKKDFKQVFSLKLKNPVHLVDINSTTDDILFIEFIKSQSENITELRLKTVYKTEPESRFKRLIKRQRFEEADTFAKTFNLDPTIALKAKAESIVDESICDSEQINSLINLMDSINESYFNLQCCMNVECSSFDDVRKILNYASEISAESVDERDEKKKLMDLLFRYETFNMLIKYNYDIQSWRRFAFCDLLKEVKDCLENLQIEVAVIIYSRMDEKTVKSLNEEFVNDVLEILKELPQDLYRSFLSTFFPITMKLLPSTMSLFVTWFKNKILDMEKRDAFNFPENVVNMVEEDLELIRVEKHSGTSLQAQCMLNCKGLEDLPNLLTGLKTLQKLKEDYGIKVELSEYLQGPKKFVSTLLRLSMPPELYNEFLTNFLQKYMLQNNLDKILAEEIKYLLKFDDIWMPTIEMIFNNINSLDIKLQIIQDLLLNSPVPWCDTVRRIAGQSSQFSHPMVEIISKMLNSEARYKVVQNRDYLINERLLDDDEEFSCIVKRIIYINEPQMIDDIFHLCSSDSQHFNATFYLVDHYILKGDLDKAMAVLEKNKPEVIHSCGRSLYEYAQIIIEQRFHKASTKEKYYNFLPLLIKKFKTSGYNEWEMEYIEKHFRLIQGQYFFKQRYGINFTAAEFKSPMELIRNIDLASMDFTEILQLAESTAIYFSKDSDEVLLQLCDTIKKFDILIQAGEYLYEKNASAKNLCLITTLFLKYLGIQHFSHFNTTVFEKIHDQTLPTFDNLNCLGETSENDKFLKGLKLGDKLIRKALAKDFSDLQIHEVSRWIDSCFSLTRRGSTLHDELFPNVYCPKQIMPSTTVLHTIQFCFHGLVTSVDVQQYKALFPSNSELQEELLTETSINTTLSSAIDTFCREGQLLTAYSLLRAVTKSLPHPCEDIKILKPLKYLLRDKCLPQLINAVVSAEHIDLDLLYNLLLAMPQNYKKCLSYFLLKHKRNSRKLNALSRVGIKLLDCFKEIEGREVMVDSVKTCKWWSRLTPVHSKMNYTEFFKSDPDTRIRLVINFNAFGLEDINSYCKDFNLDVDEYYREYLKSSLLNFTPQYKIEKTWDKRILVVENNENTLYEKCQEIISLIKDKPKTFCDMEKILKEVNFYHYEVFLTIYKILEQDTQIPYLQYNKMLLFLKEYTRFGSPGQREKEAWYITFPDAQILDPLSKFRIPFVPLLFTSEIWSILRPEVNLSSYKLWFNVTAILYNLKVDEICVYAVKHVVSSGILGSLSNDWKLYSELDDLLHKVDECVRNIKNLESATSVVYELMNNIPNGADKVKAAELSLKYAVQYKEQNANNPEVEKTFKKLKNNFYSLSVRHILRRYNLDTERYLKLVTQPEILIENLYMDERVSKHAVSLSLDYSDINNAVDAISELFGLEVQNIRFGLLNHWLHSTNDFYDVKNNSFNHLDDEDNLKRAIYICTSGNRQYWETYLLKVLKSEDVLEVKDISMAFKANAAKCFCAVTDEARIVEVTNFSYDEFLKYVDKLALLSELESLGIMLNIETLNEFSKRELLKKLSHMRKPLAIKCMGTVCITYFLEKHKYWEYIINCCIEFGMISELKTYVDFLKYTCNEQFYIKAWQVIIDQTFQEIVHVSEDYLEKTLVNNFLMIQSCPVVFSLNFEKIIEVCVNMNKREYAALLFQYMTEEKRSKMEKEILTADIDFSKLKNKGLWGVHNFLK